MRNVFDTIGKSGITIYETIDKRNMRQFSYIPSPVGAGHEGVLDTTHSSSNIVLPSGTISCSGDLSVLPIQGDSMSPEVEDGDLIFIQKVDFLVNRSYLDSDDPDKQEEQHISHLQIMLDTKFCGKALVLRLSGGTLVYKRLKKSDSDRKIILASDNTEYKDREIDIADIQQVWEVKKLLRAFDPL